MQFDEYDITIMDTLTLTEAIAYIKFLQSERRRHEKDIMKINETIREVARRFNLDNALS
jgi:hypothetical protein